MCIVVCTHTRSLDLTSAGLNTRDGIFKKLVPLNPRCDSGGNRVEREMYLSPE